MILKVHSEAMLHILHDHRSVFLLVAVIVAPKFNGCMSVARVYVVLVLPYLYVVHVQRLLVKNSSFDLGLTTIARLTVASIFVST